MLTTTTGASRFIPRSDEMHGGSATLAAGRMMDILDPVTGEPRGIRLRNRPLVLTLIELTCAGVTELPSLREARHC